ncbi:AAA family ATPase [Aquincola sp. S2]|uniref:AAA family ATPase n=2 Tax=Pseudaquabacterium terrae TaxID=2732868 RepID=A0ABX2EU23_9BURK|nr:AAA family ATPase [Aquabacterium terrae]
MRCSGCGFEPSPAFAFCPQCGQRLAGAAPTSATVDVAVEAPLPPPAAVADAADRRPVTVLFADLTGFTSLSEALDPEDVRAFQNALFTMLAEAIERHDGFVEKFVGDAVMAVFGAPVAHEDDPVRALAAALAMQQGMAELAARWAARLGRSVQLHIGVHTGPVVAGHLGAGAGSAYAVTGDTVNTTARLLSAAEPGTVLVSEATQRLARHRFAFAPAIELELRGKARTVRAHTLLRPLDEPASARGLAALGLVAPLVGRGHELGQLREAFERMLTGRAQLVVVAGEAGSGKSRLLAEWLAGLDAERRAAVTLRRVACSSLGEPTYGVFAALFREAYRVEQADSLATAHHKLDAGLRAQGAQADEAASIAGVLKHLLGLAPVDAADIDPEQLQRQIVLAAGALVERRLQLQPLLVVVEDLHWADAASVDLLGAVLDQLAGRPLMLLVTQRPEARALRAPAAGETRLLLEALPLTQARALVGALLGDAADERLQAFVAGRSGGNPLFVEEILRSLIADGRLARDPAGGWRGAPAFEQADVPATLHGLLLSRIDRLDAPARQLLQVAAALGAEFDAALLRRVEAAVERPLEALVQSDLLQPAGGARWRFTHALLHEVVYQNLLLARRSELHRRIGCALEVLAGGEPQRLAELEALGHHWSLSDDPRKGAGYLLAAGERARALYANDDAMRHFERVLRTLATVGDAASALPEALSAREALADLCGLVGRRDDALQHYGGLLARADGDGNRIRAARLQRKIGGLQWEAGDRYQALACFDAGLAALGDEGSVAAAVERAGLLQERGRLAFRAGENAVAIALAERALQAVAGVAGREAAIVEVQARNTLGIALARTGRPADAVAEIERSIALAERHQLLQAACRGHANLGVLCASLDPQRSIETCQRGLALARQVGDLGFQANLYANLAVAYCALTNRCEAEGIEAAQSAVQLDRRLGLLDHLAVPLIVLGQIQQCHGDREHAFACYREALALAERIGEPQLLFPCYDGLATLHLDAGDAASAEVYLSQAQAVCERAGLDPDALTLLPFLC